MKTIQVFKRAESGFKVTVHSALWGGGTLSYDPLNWAKYRVCGHVLLLMFLSKHGEGNIT